jgi:hypothetical protein
MDGFPVNCFLGVLMQVQCYEAYFFVLDFIHYLLNIFKVLKFKTFRNLVSF